MPPQPRTARGRDSSGPPKPGEVVDRDREWAALAQMWASPRPELVFMLGRRRIGKSFLLGTFARSVNGLYFQATRRTEPEQLSQLSRAIGEHFDDAELRHGAGFADWESLFGYVARRSASEPFLLVLDEFPYLSDSAPALPSILQWAWDHQWGDGRLKLVLSGSHITAMRRLEAADQPLYGRRTRRLVLAPFTAGEVGSFVPRWSPRDRLLAYGIVGGLPGHLRLLDTSLGIAENGASLLFDPGGRLSDEAQHMLDAFLSDATVHYSIVEAIATGEHTWKGITNRIGRTGGAALRPLEWLIGMHVISRMVPISEPAPPKSRRALYRITDPYLAFWHRFVAPAVSTGAIGMVPAERIWKTDVAPRLDDHMGAVFENACRLAVSSGRLKLPFDPVRVGEWWDASSREQIDLVVFGEKGELLVAECKWGPVNGADLAALERRCELLLAELPPKQVRAKGGAPLLAMFSGSGRADRHVAAAVKAGRVLLFTAADLV